MLSYGLRCQWPSQEGQTDVHAISDAGAGEGIPHEPLLDEEATHRDGARVVPDGEADQDLVPEQEDEAEEGNPGDKGTERTGETGSGTEGCGGGSSCCGRRTSGSKLVDWLYLDVGGG